MSTPSSVSGTRKCYHCGQSGHMGKDCTQAPKAGKEQARAAGKPASAPAAAAPAAAEPAAAASGTRKCYKCGQGGHMAKDCPSDASRPASAARPASSAAAAASSAFDDSGAAAGAGEKEDKGPSFKDRLAAYKATNPEPGKKNFCYLCGKEGHRERDCPKNSKKRDEEKLCLRCGEAGHIARVCPSIANRTVYRNEDKARKEGCYICTESGHHAEECPKLAELAEEFAKFVAKLEAGHKLHPKVFDVLIDKCARALELNGALYLWEHMKANNIDPLPSTLASLEHLHDRSAKDQSKIASIPMVRKRVARLREIVHEHRHKARQAAAEESVLPAIIAHLRLPAQRKLAEEQKSLFDLAKWLRSASIAGLTEPLSALSARTALATLKNLGRYHQRNKNAEFDLDGDVTKKGKFKTGEAAAAAAASSKKKKKKSSKKKTAAAKGEDGEADADDDEAKEEMKKEKAEPKEEKKKATKRKAAAAADAEADDAESKAGSSADAPAGKKQKTKAAAASKAAAAASAGEEVANGGDEAEEEPRASKKQKTADAKTAKKTKASAAAEEAASEEPAPAAAAAAGKKRKAKA